MKSSRPAWDFVSKTVPSDAIFLGYDLDENTEGFLYYYGRAPAPLDTLEQASESAARRKPAYLLLVERREKYEMPKEFFAPGKWELTAEKRFGRRTYRIFGNSFTRS